MAEMIPAKINATVRATNHIKPRKVETGQNNHARPISPKRMRVGVQRFWGLGSDMMYQLT
jgi:hypothetical protein